MNKMIDIKINKEFNKQQLASALDGYMNSTLKDKEKVTTFFENDIYTAEVQDLVNPKEKKEAKQQWFISRSVKIFITPTECKITLHNDERGKKLKKGTKIGAALSLADPVLFVAGAATGLASQVTSQGFFMIEIVKIVESFVRDKEIEKEEKQAKKEEKKEIQREKKETLKEIQREKIKERLANTVSDIKGIAGTTAQTIKTTTAKAIEMREAKNAEAEKIDIEELAIVEDAVAAEMMNTEE